MTQKTLDRLRDNFKSDAAIVIREADPLTDDEFATLCDEIKGDGRSRVLTLRGFDVPEGWVKKIAETLPESKLRNVLILECRLEKKEEVSSLIEALPHSPYLSGLEFRGTELLPEQIVRLGEVLPETNIDHLNVSSCGMDQAGLASISQALAESKTLHALYTFNNPATDEIGEGYGVLLKALTQNRSLRNFGFRNSPSNTNSSVSCPEIEGEFLEAERQLVFSGPPNLTNFKTHTQSHFAEAMSEMNQERVRSQTEMVLRGEIEDLDLSARFDLFERIDGIMKMLGNKSSNAQLIGSERIANYFDQFPQLNGDQPITEEAVLKTNEAGYRPIDHPQTWIDHPNFLERLLAESADPQDLISRELTDDGKTLIDYAMAMGHFADNLKALNQYGWQVQRDALLDNNGELTELGTRMANDGRGFEALFRAQNWSGASKQDLAAVVEAMPETARKRINNLHGLQVQIDRTQESTRLR